LKDNRLFAAAIAVSVILHLYLLKVNFTFEEGGRGEIKIPVIFIPEAKKIPMEKPSKNEKQITLPDDKPSSGGYYSTYNKNKLMNSYLELIRKEISNRKFSPLESMSYGLLGNAIVGFTITGNGDFIGIKILRSSGDPLLDKTALNAVSASSGKVKRPAASGRDDVRVNVAVKYQYGL
jgi:TonB family protein